MIKPLRTFTDERGFFTEIFSTKWEENFSDKIVQTNMSITYPDIVRAWHKHERGQVDYFTSKDQLKYVHTMKQTRNLMK